MKKILHYKPVAESIVELFYPHVEVVIHDLIKNRIAAIYNSFSKRKVGDDSLLENDVDWDTESGKWKVYEKTNWNTRKVKSVSSILRDHSGVPVGIMCINLDVSALEGALSFIQNFLGQTLEVNKPTELFKDDWQERINKYVAAYLKTKKISLKEITPEHKKKLILKLHQEGAFSAKNAAQYVAEVLELSRATVYNYLK